MVDTYFDRNSENRALTSTVVIPISEVIHHFNNDFMAQLTPNYATENEKRHLCLHGWS